VRHTAAVGANPVGRQTGGAPAVSSWQPLKEWTGGPGTLDTGHFTTVSPLFRVAWSLTDLGRGGVLDVYVRRDKGRLIKAGVSLQASDPTKPRGTGAGTFEVKSEPGDHYLEIHSTGAEWRVAVEQPKDGR
jgi:hypothetical protein